MKQFSNKILIPIYLFVASSSAIAQQRLEMEGTAIIGNKELPKVLYIVPWKSAERIALDSPPYDSVLNQPLQPLDRPTFKRQVNYYHELYAPVENNP